MNSLIVCLSVIHKRYGDVSLSGFSGYQYVSKSAGFSYLFFSMVLSNMPLTMSFIGEDVILHALFAGNFFKGLMVLTIFSLGGISLYRSYCMIFCGKTTGLPRFPLFTEERFVLALMIFCGIALPLGVNLVLR